MLNKYFSVIMIILMILITVSSGCVEPPKLPISERNFQIGTAGFVPRNFPNSTEDDWKDFFNEVPSLGELFGAYFS
jgi:hypothetical protein